MQKLNLHVMYDLTVNNYLERTWILRELEAQRTRAEQGEKVDLRGSRAKVAKQVHVEAKPNQGKIGNLTARNTVALQSKGMAALHKRWRALNPRIKFALVLTISGAVGWTIGKFGAYALSKPSLWTPSIPTSIPNVSATKKAFSLAERFFSCPAAAKVLESERFIKPILIDTHNISGALCLTFLDNNYNSLEARILIPEKNLQTTKSLDDLAFEIFNAQGASNSLHQQASLGNVGMDSFARQVEEIERANTQEHYELLKKCGNHWSMSPEELEKYTRDENLHPEIHLFTQETFCHTDVYRQKWVEQFQKTYCAKHPEEKRSCDTKMTDLCSFDMVLSMPDSERNEFIRERICKLFPQAHVTVKNDPGIRAVIEAKCPEVLEKSSPQSIQDEL
jgi:hypothetical protein